MWGNEQAINEPFLGWAERWDELRAQLRKYANYHPSDKVKTQAEEVCTAVVAALGSTRYLSLFPRSDTMDAFNAATERQKEAVALAQELMETIRRY